jgi:hypothetical protein
MTHGAATAGFYDLDDRFLWTGQQVSMTWTLDFYDQDTRIWNLNTSVEPSDFFDTDDKFLTRMTSLYGS